MLKVAAVNGIAFGLCAGCVSTPVLKMTYHSDPEGATLYEGGRLLGFTPVTLTYPDGRTAFARNECLPLNSMHVRWASGVVASNTSLQACPARGFVQAYMFVRPPDAPGADIDAHYALRLLQNGELRQKANSQDATVVAESIRSQNGE
ncbi:MAG TPA: hypothetical protein VK820_04085 [Steroidobacteraceae bacterium]|jgi:hypothetical protein|nr:hypothetical protein [Steroidobacteraceae bacterium]